MPRCSIPLLLALTLASSARAEDFCPAGGGDTRTALLLSINDVYRIEGLESGSVGGLARVRSLRRELERSHPDLLMLHAGDLLFPSLASRILKGEQMIAVLNALDGDSGAVDRRMFVTFGNHEFDENNLADAGTLNQRLKESQFTWLAGNLAFAQDDQGKPLVGGKNVVPRALIESGGIKVGLFGLTIPMEKVQYVSDFAGPEATARKLSAELRAAGAEVVVAVTHLNAADDRRLLERLGAAGPDLIVGGHDHERMAQEVGGRWLVKADADARSAALVCLVKRKDGRLEVRQENRALAAANPPPDPEVEKLADAWQDFHALSFCHRAGARPGCLNEEYGRTRTVLEAEESKIRGRETSLGDWVTDQMLATFRSCGAQAAFINSGSLRLNHDLAAGTVLTRRHLEELVAYKTPLYLLTVDGSILQMVAEQAVRAWPGSGSWLQISGFGFRHLTQPRQAVDVSLGPPETSPRVQPGQIVKVVTGDYLLNPALGDQDGYSFLTKDLITPCEANGRDLKEILVQALKAAEPLGIAPVAEGRIVQQER
ncbi:MAG TPA: 5'-nucleotidase C-terminal domain-containing protein [Thermoanaerobaculia bacterium]|nr:5'-nucleotidase C-terminal domain-containing protein [Thermoanaerobaculia bacterium]